jgi:ABC-2 type transport system permease protein
MRGRSVDVALAAAKRELLEDLRQRNHFVLNWTGHLLGALPFLLTGYGMAGARRSAGLLAEIGFPDWTAFVLLGYAAYAAFGVGNPLLTFTGLWWSVTGEQQTGTLERTFVAPAPREAVVAGKAIYYFAMYLFHVLTLLLFTVLLAGASMPTDRLALVAPVLLGVMAMSLGLGLITTAVTLAWREAFFTFIHRPALLLSGAYFVVPVIPEPFRSLAYLNPVAHAVDALRGAVTGTTVLFALPVEIAIVALLALVMPLLGMWLLRRLIDRLRRTGELAFA